MSEKIKEGFVTIFATVWILTPCLIFGHWLGSNPEEPYSKTVPWGVAAGFISGVGLKFKKEFDEL